MFGLDETLVGLLLAFQEADVFEGHTEDGVDGGSEKVGEGIRVLDHLAQLAGVFVWVFEMALAENGDGSSQVSGRDVGDGGDVEVLGQDVGAGDAKVVGEGLDAAVVAGEEVDESESKGFLGGEGVGEAAIGAGELAEGQIARVKGVVVLDAYVAVVLAD